MDTENNRLLAEFMGLKPKLESPDVYSYSDMPFFSVRESCPEKVMESISKYVKYNSSWDWLMPCVDKIEKLLPDDSVITIEYKNCYIPVLNDKVPFTIEGSGETKIEAVYNACVEFVKWYNSVS